MTLEELQQRVQKSGQSGAELLETEAAGGGALGYRALIGIEECGEPLVEIPHRFFPRFEPHPYQSLGAPYGNVSPFFARKGAVERLEGAQRELQRRHAGLQLKIFDAFRPHAVQQFMVDFTAARLARERGLDFPAAAHDERESILRAVYSIWARPSDDPALPTPHSTGGAIDLTLVDAGGAELRMGGAIDEISARSLPNYYRLKSGKDFTHYHSNRELLCSVMESAGFRRLSHEWWHFSYGDQMWGLLQTLDSGESVPARYGRWTAS